jgi:hypothetical protein
MWRWFLSYHSPDEELADRLKAALKRKDRDSRVFFAPSSLRAGGFWSRALAEEIAQADAFILLVGDKGIGDWQVLEYDEALDRRVKSPNFAVVLVLLKGQKAPGLPFLRRLHWIVTADPGSENAIARLIDAAAGAGTRLGELWRHTSPYRGLEAMEAKDSDYFFGREQEIVDVVSALAAAPCGDMASMAHVLGHDLESRDVRGNRPAGVLRRPTLFAPLRMRPEVRNGTTESRRDQTRSTGGWTGAIFTEFGVIPVDRGAPWHLAGPACRSLR